MSVDLPNSGMIKCNKNTYMVNSINLLKYLVLYEEVSVINNRFLYQKNSFPSGAEYYLDKPHLIALFENAIPKPHTTVVSGTALGAANLWSSVSQSQIGRQTESIGIP